MENLTHLYDISDEILNVLRPDSEEIINEKDLDLLFLKFDDKTAACLAVLKNMKATLKMVTVERKRLQGAEHTLDTKIENLAEYVMGEMIRVERPMVDYGTHKAFVSNSPLTIDVNMNLLPEEWHKPPKEHQPEPDKLSILEHVKETGEELPGVTLKQNKHLRITK